MKDKSKNGCKKRRARQLKTPYQLKKLKEAYTLGAYLTEETTTRLSESLGLTKRQVMFWFQSQRQKNKRKRMMDDSVDESDNGSPSRSRSGSGSDFDSSSDESDSSHSNEPLEDAKPLGQIASQQTLAQTLTPTEIELRIEKEVKTRVASHVELLRVEMEEKMEAMNVNLKRDIFGRRNHGSPQSDSSQFNESVVDRVVVTGDIKNEMINMLMEKNKRDNAKCRSLLDEIMRLENSIEDREKLIDDIKKIS